jgi:hypothetical protein
MSQRTLVMSVPACRALQWLERSSPPRPALLSLPRSRQYRKPGVLLVVKNYTGDPLNFARSSFASGGCVTGPHPRDQSPVDRCGFVILFVTYLDRASACAKLGALE